MRRSILVLLAAAAFLLAACGGHTTVKHVDQGSPAAATSQGPAASAARGLPPMTYLPAAHQHLFGAYVSDWPGTPEGDAELQRVIDDKLDMVVQYSAIDAGRGGLDDYLARAAQAHIQVGISLKDLFPQTKTNVTEVWNNQQQFAEPVDPAHPRDELTRIARGVVRDYVKSPAVREFYLTDERPESPDTMGDWITTLQQRYNELKDVMREVGVNKPIMSNMVGWTADSATARQAFLKKVPTDELSADYYPVGYAPMERIAPIAADLKAVAGDNSWFVFQIASWKQYAQTDASAPSTSSQMPSVDEMVKMGNDALSNGSRNLIAFAYPTIEKDPAQQKRVSQAWQQLRAKFN